MARHKDIHTASWSGDIITGGRDTVLVLHPSNEPSRILLFTISPSNAKRLTEHLEKQLARAQFVVD